MTIENIHDYIWYKITDFKSYPVHFDDLKTLIKLYFRELYF